jgi:Rieske 2Fe-2S family protein
MSLHFNQDLTRRDIAALVAQRKRGYSLEAPFYISREIFDLDSELIFGRHWIYAGVEAELPEAGDYFTVVFGCTSVIVLRDDNGDIRAFHNVCRHRGSRLVTAERGFVGKLVCPYHQWTYDLDGSLLHADAMAADFDRRCFSLRPVHLKSLGGLLFICLAEDPPGDFEDMQKEVEPYLAPHGLRDCKVAKQIDIVEAGNWKLTMENNRECYHCGGHPELGRSFFQVALATDNVPPSQRRHVERYLRAQEEFKDIWDGIGLPWQPIEKLDDRPTGFRCERVPLDNAGESYTMDTRVASKRLLGSFNSPRLGDLHLHTQPNSWHHFLSDHAITFATLPLSSGRTLVRTTWLVHKDAVEGVDYDVGKLTEVWRVTNDQDSAFVANAQLGSVSPAYVPGPYSSTEHHVEKFCRWYMGRLSAHLAPLTCSTT